MVRTLFPTIALILLASGCSPARDADRQQRASNDSMPSAGPVAEHSQSENTIPLSMRGLWRPVTSAGRVDAGPDCSGPTLRIDVDRLAYPYLDALLESIDQISADYLRATFSARVGGRIERYDRTMAVSADEARLTIRGTDAAGERTIERYRRCSQPVAAQQ